MKLNSSIKIPMIIGMILQFVAITAYLIIIFLQKSLLDSRITDDINRIVIPADFYLQLIIAVLYAIFFLVMSASNSGSQRVQAVVMLIAYSLVRIANPYIIMLSNYLSSRYGAAHLAASSTLNSTANLVVSPLVIIAAILILVSIGRYGIIDEDANYIKQ